MSAIHSQSSSDALIVISANIEGLIVNRASILSEFCKDKHCHCLCLQETHRAKDQARPSIPGMALVVERPHNKHGSTVFVRDGLKVNSISVCEEDNVEFITVELPGVVVHSVYKPPAEQFLLPPLGSRNMPHIVIGDFNDIEKCHRMHTSHKHTTSARRNAHTSHTRAPTALRITIQTEDTTSIISLTQIYNILQHSKA